MGKAPKTWSHGSPSSFLYPALWHIKNVFLNKIIESVLMVMEYKLKFIYFCPLKLL
jgi:hypothetical protein